MEILYKEGSYPKAKEVRHFLLRMTETHPLSPFCLWTFQTLFLYCMPRPDNEMIMNHTLLVDRHSGSAWIYARKFNYIYIYCQVVRIEWQHFEDATSVRSAFSNKSTTICWRMTFLCNLDRMEVELYINYLMYKKFNYFTLDKYLYFAN